LFVDIAISLSSTQVSIVLWEKLTSLAFDARLLISALAGFTGTGAVVYTHQWTDLSQLTPEDKRIAVTFLAMAHVSPVMYMQRRNKPQSDFTPAPPQGPDKKLSDVWSFGAEYVTNHAPCKTTQRERGRNATAAAAMGSSPLARARTLSAATPQIQDNQRIAGFCASKAGVEPSAEHAGMHGYMYVYM